MPNTLKANATFDEVIERNKDKFVVEENGCWIWQLKGNSGYAKFTYNKKKVQAHRKLYELKFGVVLSDEIEAHHKCNNTKCINPDHVEPKTRLEHRIIDKSKITLAQAEQIKSEYLSGQSTYELAVLYGTTPNTIGDALKQLGVKLRGIGRYAKR